MGAVEEEFATRSAIVHVDVDPSEINKIKQVQLPICSDVKYALAELNKVVRPPADLGALSGARPADDSLWNDGQGFD
jgi:thiamine pyrophosphate-dependent acetolactate synthase large subunit-like protein